MTRALGEAWLLPALDDANRAFWTGGRIVIQACAACGTLHHPPTDVCGSCQGTEFGLRESAGLGRIESVAVVHHPVHPALADAVPYAIVVVSLDDAPGVHWIGNVVDCPPGEVAIGQRGRVRFEQVADPDGGEAISIPQWEIVPDEAD